MAFGLRQAGNILHGFVKMGAIVGKKISFQDNKATAAAVISRLRISNNGELKEI